MPLSDLEARTVDQNQEKIRKQSWSDIKNQLNSWPKVKRSGITPSFHVWSMSTIVMPLIIVRLHFRHGELEKPVGKSVWNGLISTHITLYTVHFLGKVLQLGPKGQSSNYDYFHNEEGSFIMIRILPNILISSTAFTSKQDFEKCI